MTGIIGTKAIKKSLTEPGAGSDVEETDGAATARLSCRYRRVAGGYRISGRKCFISDGAVARWITLFAAETGKGIEVLNEIVGGVIPREYIKPTIDGIMEAANNGVVAGYPVIDFKAHIIGFAMTDEQTVDLRLLADATGGLYADAGDAECLREPDRLMLQCVMQPPDRKSVV